MKQEESDTEVGGQTIMAKAQAGIVLYECARCAVLPFEDNPLTTIGKDGMGERISDLAVR